MYTPSAAEKQKTKILENMKNSTNVKKTTNSLEYIDSLYIEPERWKYFAGMIDGDGYLGSYVVYQYKNKQKIKPNNISIQIIISTSTSLKSLQEQKNELKGYTSKIYPDPNKDKVYNSNMKNCRNYWRLNLTGTDEEKIKFLEKIKPYLDNKQRQCELLIQILKGVDILQSLKELELLNSEGKDKTFTDEEKLLLEKYSNKRKIKFPIKRTHFIDDNIISSAGKGAGCVDSDGSIYMNKDYRLFVLLNTSSKESYTYKLEQNIINSDEFYSTFTDKNKTKDNVNPSRHIRIIYKYHLQFLKQILPYMITRREQALVAIDYLEKRISKIECYKKLKDLNKRGKKNWGEEDIEEKITPIKSNEPKIELNIEKESIINTMNVEKSTVNVYPVNVYLDNEIVNPLGVDDGRRIRRNRKR